jgi:N6-L-threonylcarbamoyladenine synthase
LGIVTSGGHTEVVLIKSIGHYQIIAQTSDDALGESLDKVARLLGFGYPGGEILEKLAKDGIPNAYKLPIPMLGREKEMYFSYSGLKTAFVRLLKEVKGNNKELTINETSDLAASYQYVAFIHFIRVLEYILKSNRYPVKYILAGGGVMANVTLRKMIRQTTQKYNVSVLFPYSTKLYGDNAAMIGIAANYKFERKEFLNSQDLDKVDRIPRAKVDKLFAWGK